MTGTEINREQLAALFDLTLRLKRERGRHERPLVGKILALVFSKPSTRTRVSFEVAMRELGGDVISLQGAEMQIDRGETPFDTGAVMSRYVHAIAVRTTDHENLLALAAGSEAPVINALTDRVHPCQMLADMFTLWERFGRLEDVRLAFVGDGCNNVTHSLILAVPLTGLRLTVASPPGFEPDPRILAMAERMGAADRVTVTQDPAEAVEGADAIYTDVWTSMGREQEQARRRHAFAGYQINSGLCRLARSHFVFMHCLPAHRGEEVTADVLDGPHSIVLDQAENRLHTQKALLTAILAESA